MSTPTTQVTWFVARNHLGQFSHGECWVDDIANARLYRTIGPAKAAATRLAKEHPDWPVAQVLEWKLDIATATVLDVSARTKAGIARRKVAEIERKRRDVARRLTDLSAQEKRLAAERALLEASQT